MFTHNVARFNRSNHNIYALNVTGAGFSKYSKLIGFKTDVVTNTPCSKGSIQTFSVMLDPN